MPEDLIIENDGLTPEEFEEDIYGNIANLSTAYSTLAELDGGLMDKIQQKKLKKMREQVFNALVYFCDCLPEPEE